MRYYISDFNAAHSHSLRIRLHKCATELHEWSRNRQESYNERERDRQARGSADENSEPEKLPVIELSARWHPHVRMLLFLVFVSVLTCVLVDRQFETLGKVPMYLMIIDAYSFILEYKGASFDPLRCSTSIALDPHAPLRTFRVEHPV